MLWFNWIYKCEARHCVHLHMSGSWSSGVFDISECLCSVNAAPHEHIGLKSNRSKHFRRWSGIHSGQNWTSVNASGCCLFSSSLKRAMKEWSMSITYRTDARWRDITGATAPGLPAARSAAQVSVRAPISSLHWGNMAGLASGFCRRTQEECLCFIKGKILQEKTLFPLHGNFELHPPRGRYGERPQRDSCLKIRM